MFCPSALNGSQTVPRSARAAFTLTELLIVILVIVILMAMLLPVVQAVRANARTVHCQKNLGQLVSTYVKLDNRAKRSLNLEKTGGFNEFAQYMNELIGDSQDVWNCTDNEKPDIEPSYGFNLKLHRLGTKDAQKLVALGFGESVANVVGLPINPSDIFWDTNWSHPLRIRHGGLINVAFYGTHVEARTVEEIDPRVCEIQLKHWLPTLSAKGIDDNCN